MVLRDTSITSDDNKVEGSIGIIQSTHTPSSLVQSLHDPSLISIASKERQGDWLALMANDNGES